jgi:predicted dehydrogenase
MNLYSSSASLHSPIGIALVGTGFGLKVHLPALRESDHFQVVAVYHREQQQAKAVAQAHNIPSAFGDFDMLLAQPEIQGLCLSTPPFLHYEMAVQALEAGKHVFLEKPVTMTAGEAKKLYALSLQHQCQLGVDFEFRYVPAWMALKAKLERNEIGRPRLIKVDWIVPGRADPSRSWSWHASAEAGGGSLGALGSHTFDYITWLFGPIRQICARLATSIEYRPDPASGLPKTVSADDTCMILLELMDGTPVQIGISAVAYSGRGHWIEIYGDRGALKLGSDHQTDYVHGFKLWESQGKEMSEASIPKEYEFQKTYSDGRIAPVKRALEQWAAAIATGETSVPSIREGAYAQLLMDLAHESHETGCWVKVPEIESFLD